MTAHCHKLFGQQWRLKVAAFALMVLHIPLQSICMAQDTLRVLEEVEVSSQRPPATLHTPVPTQVMDAATLEQNGALQLSDAVRAMAGVVVKDYGGVGGMKTVSARGLGSQFSTLTIDGVPVDNAQNGQADLGRYLLGNAAYVSLSQGQQHDGLLSARGYAAGNVLNMVTAEPEFFLLRRTNLRFSFEGGSFGLRSPSVLWEQKWTSRLRSSLWINHLRSDGDYPFTLYYTASRTDSSSRERRLHSAMQMTTLDANLFYTIASDNRLMFKAHYSGGTHQLPGHVRYYRQEPSAQQTAEQQLFLQGRWTLERELWQMQWMAKYQHSYDQYEDSNFLSSSTHYLMNYYRQQGGYLSGSTLWHVRPWADVGVAADADLAHLHSNLAQRSNVLRRSLIGVAIMQLHYGSWEAKANLVLTDVADRVGDLDTTPQYRRLAPYVAILYSPSLGLNLRLFYKNSYRPPTFSELYFFQSLPRSLRPEKAHQLNAGITVATNQLSITADAYFNRVWRTSDKCTSGGSILRQNISGEASSSEVTIVSHMPPTAPTPPPPTMATRYAIRHAIAEAFRHAGKVPGSTSAHRL